VDADVDGAVERRTAPRAIEGVQVIVRGKEDGLRIQTLRAAEEFAELVTQEDLEVELVEQLALPAHTRLQFDGGNDVVETVAGRRADIARFDGSSSAQTAVFGQAQLPGQQRTGRLAADAETMLEFQLARNARTNALEERFRIVPVERVWIIGNHAVQEGHIGRPAVLQPDQTGTAKVAHGGV